MDWQAVVLPVQAWSGMVIKYSILFYSIMILFHCHKKVALLLLEQEMYTVSGGSCHWPLQALAAAPPPFSLTLFASWSLFCSTYTTTTFALVSYLLSESEVRFQILRRLLYRWDCKRNWCFLTVNVKTKPPMQTVQQVQLDPTQSFPSFTG